ncbi:Hypothetical protein CINCED_3A020191 [Cinara cedri]|uniref:Uncharacterized protein n=1 Tax=Cinara cedri TaxID=506608 RepID=A0A5E4MDD0_9HEMI|nr:Hypothetical protein CINCED_3A020191 [Cinara cedri]
MHVAIRVYVTNVGLKTVEFFLDISDQNLRENCEKQTVHPQQTIECRLNLECLANKCIAIMCLYTVDCIGPAVVAYRKFGVIRGCRCYCLWRARCECYGPHFGRIRVLNRSPLTQFEYNEAGFLGDALPCKAADEFATLARDIVSGSLGLLVTFVAVTITLGLAKAASPYRSHWLWIVPSNYPSSKMDVYKELELKLCTVVRDEWGYCVHPITKSRNIRLFDRFREFVMNVVFFFNLPVTFWWYLRSAKYSREECDFSTDH